MEEMGQTDRLVRQGRNDRHAGTADEQIEEQTDGRTEREAE